MPRTKILLLASVFAACAVLLSYVYLTTKEKSIINRTVPKKVLIAVKYIAAGTRVTNDMFETNEIVSDSVQPGAIVNSDDVVGQVSLSPIAVGEQLLANKFLTTGTSVTSSIPLRKRGVTISVNEATDFIKIIKPGDYVDVLVTFETSSPYTSTILQNVKIVAIGENFSPLKSDDSKKSEMEMFNNLSASVTLALTPQESEILAFAENKGRLKLALRARGDEEILELKPVNFNTISSSKKEESSPVKKESYPSLEIIRGIQGEKIPIKK
ncbi:MAG: Flp pilus assembly protein CpaB [Candidatus Firestonebacteria bacterium]